MTQEEFCKLTGIVHISGEDFAAIHTLYIATGEMNKNVFTEEIKRGLAVGTSEAYGTFACTPMWMDMTAKEINRLDAENRRLRTMVRDLEEAAREREATIKSLEEDAKKQEAENVVLRGTFKEVGDAARSREKLEAENKKDLAYNLRLCGDRLDDDELKRMAEELCGAEFTARKAMLHGMKLTENEENALVVAMEELDVYRGGKKK